MELVQAVAFNYPILLVSSADHLTGLAGLTPTIYLSKAGAAFQLITPLVIDLGFGEYTVVLTSAHTNTLGSIVLRITAPGADPLDTADQVVPASSTLLSPASGTIAMLAMLKLVLGIDLDDTDQDLYLAQLLRNATIDVEGMTHRRWREPASFTEYRIGNGNRTMFLRGHIDDVNAVDSGSDDPATSLVVSRRAVMFGSTTTWEDLVEDEAYERRGDKLIFIQSWYVWPCEDEFRLRYLNGWTIAPEDIREAIVQMAMDQYLVNLNASSGTSGITSEKLGDFSYTVDLGAVTSGTGRLSDTTARTIQRYKRRFV